MSQNSTGCRGIGTIHSLIKFMGGIAMSESAITSANTEYIQIENTTFEVRSFYDGKTPLLDLIKNALKRDADEYLRSLDNN